MFAGQVKTDEKEKDYIGAAAHTNNTGELSAMYYALRRAERRGRGRGREEIHSDSLYAINMTTGKWMPRRRHRNTAMIESMRRLWRRVQQKRPREVKLCHVRSHIKVPGNEIADWLAGCGAVGSMRPGSVVSLQSATQWTREWLRRQDQNPPPRDENAQRGGGGHGSSNQLGDPRGVG